MSARLPEAALARRLEHLLLRFDEQDQRSIRTTVARLEAAVQEIIGLVGALPQYSHCSALVLSQHEKDLVRAALVKLRHIPLDSFRPRARRSGAMTMLPEQKADCP
jgi:hypothetical protein